MLNLGQKSVFVHFKALKFRAKASAIGAFREASIVTGKIKFPIVRS